jgi:hypothetical protein
MAPCPRLLQFFQLVKAPNRGQLFGFNGQSKGVEWLQGVGRHRRNLRLIGSLNALNFSTLKNNVQQTER